MVFGYLKSLVLYFSVFFLSMFFSECWQRVSKNGQKRVFFSRSFFAILTIAPAVFLAGIRYNIGTDYSAYVEMFQDHTLLSAWSIEPLYAMINVALSIIAKNNPEVLFSFISLVTVGAVYFVIEKNQDKLSLPLALFFFYTYFYLHSYNVQRQCVAMAFCFVAIDFSLKRRFVGFFISVTIASMLHYSALIGYLFYFLYFGTNSRFAKTVKWLYYLLIIFSPWFILTIYNDLMAKIPFLAHKLAGSYASNSFSMNYGFGWSVEVLPIIFLIVSFRKQLTEKEPRHEILFNIALLAFPLRYAGYVSATLSRLYLYPAMTIILIAPIIMKNIKSVYNKVFLFCFFFLWFLEFFVSKFVIKNFGEVFPYQCIFGGSMLFFLSKAC